MSKRDKLRRKLRNNPDGVTLHDLQTLSQRFGFTLARTSGSHHIFEYADGVRWEQIVVPVHRQRVKSAYVKEAMRLLDRLFPEEDNSSDA